MEKPTFIHLEGAGYYNIDQFVAIRSDGSIALSNDRILHVKASAAEIKAKLESLGVRFVDGFAAYTNFV